MSLGNRLRERLDQRQQKEVAASWCEGWNATHADKPMRPEYVIQQLSRCLNDKAPGVRFFFSNSSERASLLLDVLECSPQERDEIHAAALDVLQTAPPSPSVLFDLTSWTAEKAFATALDSVRKLLELRPTPELVILLVTESQYERLPLGVGQREGVRCEVARDRVRGQIQELAGENTLVVSPHDYEPVERWLAWHISYGDSLFDPRDGFEQFFIHGVLPGPAAISEPTLADLDVEIEDDVELPSSPLERRKLWFDLADPSSKLNNTHDPEHRRALARALGAGAALSVKEREAWDFERSSKDLKARFGLATIQKTHPTLLAQELRHRHFRAQPTAVVQVDEVFHVLLDPDADASAVPSSDRIRVHQPRPCAPLDEIYKVLETWTVEDYSQDPYYDRLVQRLAPPKDAELLYRHAQSFLLLSGVRPPYAASSEPAPWDVALEAILAEGPPPAQLVVMTDFTEAEARVAGRPTTLLELRRGLRDELGSDSPDWRSRACPASVGCLFVGRQDRVLLVSNKYSAASFLHESSGRIAAPQSALFSLKLADGDPNATWRGLVRASSTLCGQLDDELLRRENARGFRRYEKENDWGRPDIVYKRTQDSIWLLESWHSNTQELAIATDIWRPADAELGVLWMVLEQALRKRVRTVLHDGTVLLALGGSLFARLQARTWPKGVSAPVRRACFGAAPDSSARGLQIHRSTHHTHQATTDKVITQIGLSLPSTVSLIGGGHVVDIEFVAPPLGSALDHGGPSVGAATASVTAHLEREAQQRRDEDDDD
jgi:hypothetical protein